MLQQRQKWEMKERGTNKWDQDYNLSESWKKHLFALHSLYYTVDIQTQVESAWQTHLKMFYSMVSRSKLHVALWLNEATSQRTRVAKCPSEGAICIGAGEGGKKFLTFILPFIFQLKCHCLPKIWNTGRVSATWMDRNSRGESNMLEKRLSGSFHNNNPFPLSVLFIPDKKVLLS